MITANEIKEVFPKLKKLSKFERQIQFAALITECMKAKNIKPVIVGGLAVEIYTRNDYQTQDIDFVSDGWDKFNSILTDLGFIRTEREWYHTDLEIAVEVPSNVLEGSEEHIVELELLDGKNVYVISVEDIIIHRLEGIVFSTTYPKEDEDDEWAHRLFLIHRDNLDLTYLKEQAEATKVLSFIKEWMK